jgi:uroporphyrin-III C-methyltransferase/precorrin-2 dehydrogenase/sirohydrochlorin ferrochelatase
VAKRAGGGGTAQESIHRLLVRSARRGKRVVRLKGGDPFVFGRGGEEALALAAAGVPFEIVPGISSAVAAPALAGIPVTHRGTASGFVVVAGQSAAAYRPVLDGLRPGVATVVVLMGVAARAELASFLLERGWPAGTPAALLLAASRPEAESWIGTLAELGEAEVPRALADAAGTLVIGEVVAVGAAIAVATANDSPAARAAAVEGGAGRRAGSRRVVSLERNTR